MFQESLVESTPLLRSHNRWPVFVSFATQAAILTLVILIPLLHPEILPTHGQLRLDFLPSPVRPPAPPPPPQPVRMQAAPATSASSAPPTQQPIINSTVAHEFTSDAPPVANPIIAIARGPGHNAVPFSPAAAPPAPVVAPAPSAPHSPLNISEGVLAGNLLAPIQPVYPAIAKIAGVQGTVIIQATISPAGRIENAHVVSGPAMLQAAALEAVRNARYRPYLLNRQPTEVETTFSINFRINGD